MTDKQIKQLRTFFRITNAAFDFTNVISQQVSKAIYPSKMQQLHKLALLEVEKENPNPSTIDALLKQMEDLAEFNSEQENHKP